MFSCIYPWRSWFRFWLISFFRLLTHIMLTLNNHFIKIVNFLFLFKVWHQTNFYLSLSTIICFDCCLFFWLFVTICVSIPSQVYFEVCFFRLIIANRSLRLCRSTMHIVKHYLVSVILIIFAFFLLLFLHQLLIWI